MPQYNKHDVLRYDHDQRYSVDLAQSYTRVPLPEPPRSSFEIAEPRKSLPGIHEEFHHRRSSLNIAREDLNNQNKLKTGVVVTIPTFDNASKEAEHVKKTKKKGIERDIQKDLEIDYHKIDVNELVRRFDTDAQDGLTEDVAKKRLAEYGPNEVALRNKYLWIWKLITYIFGGFGFVLWPSAILAIISYKPLGNPNPDPSNLGLGIILFIVIFLNAFFDGWQDFQSTKVMNSIGGMLPSEATVIRNGVKRNDVQARTLVIGDLVEVKIGEKVPADLRLIRVQQLKVDNSILTGESEPISCTINMTDENFMETKNLLFMGTSITEGAGVGIVVATGNNTIMGKITKSTSRGGKITPIRKEIFGFIAFAVIMAVILSIACLLAWIFWLRVYHAGFLTVSSILIIILTSVVAFIPEGLPVSVSMTFTVMARRMFLQNVLVKHLPTVETLGSIDIIASDKTGTLTQNKMSVMNIFTGTRTIEFHQFQKTYDSNDVTFKELVRISALCNRAVFDENTINLPLLQRKVIGDASDTGILLFAERLLNVHHLREQYRELCVIPFNSKNKWMLNILTAKNDSSNNATIFMKGAAEIITEKCSKIMMADGTEQELTQELREQIIHSQEHFSSEGQRVLGCCMQKLDPQQYPADSYPFNAEEINFPLDGHCFVGLVALIDPPREDVFTAIERCQNAGIRVMMVTGDHHVTASAIARMVGIVKHDPEHTIDIKDNNTLTAEMCDSVEDINSRALTVRGPVIPTLNKETWDRILMHKEICWARTTPEHKLRIVKECQARKHVVAVTGDGVNDAPALKQANVGVAMGAGSEVAREAAAIVLMDSRFSSIVVGIENGRIAFENLKKVLLYLLPAGSFSEIMPIILNVFFGIPLPLSSFLMIMICVGTDIFPSLSLISEMAEADLMEREPRSITGEKLVNVQLIFHAYFFTGVFEAVAAMIMYFYYMDVYAGIPGTSLLFAFQNFQDGFYGLTNSELDNYLFTAQSIYFVTLVIIQLGNLLSTRTRRLSFFQHLPFRRATRNMKLFVAMLISVVIALLLLHIPFFNNVFNTRPIPVQFWFIPIGWALLYFCLDEIRKLIARQFPFRYARKIFW